MCDNFYSLDLKKKTIEEYSKCMRSDKSPSRSKFCSNHSINENTFKAWLRKFNSHKRLCGNNGRPPYIDSLHLEQCRLQIIDASKVYQKRDNQVTNMLLDAAKNTAHDLYQADKDLVQLPAPKTIVRYKKKNGSCFTTGKENHCSS